MDHVPLPLKKALVRCVIWFSTLAAFINLCIHAINVHERATNSPSCQWNAVPNPDAFPCAARWCKLTKDTVLLRLYDAKVQHLLAERTYFQLDRPNLGRALNYFWYDSYPDDAFIELPPSIFERLRAKLP